jgi:hypothetical protein
MEIKYCRIILNLKLEFYELKNAKTDEVKMN